MIKSLVILLLVMVVPAFGAILLQSCHTTEAWESISLTGAFNLAVYIIEEYDPATEATQSICLSDKSCSSSQSSHTKETVEFVEKSYSSQLLLTQQPQTSPSK